MSMEMAFRVSIGMGRWNPLVGEEVQKVLSLYAHTSD